MNETQKSLRYDLLCRATQGHETTSSLDYHLKPYLDGLQGLLETDLRALARLSSLDNFADIYFNLQQDLERFREFCAFPALAGKTVVAFGGGFSAGKSSLINALLGEKLLVTEVDPTTSLPTYLMHASENSIQALNFFGHRVPLSTDEFLTLTHDELEHYGSNISRLLRSVFIGHNKIPWKNLTLIDTPGYTKHEDASASHQRTDEQIARSQLSVANAIVWVIDARQGCITEDDLKFLASLPTEIPKLVVVSRADQKSADDIPKILSVIRNALTASKIQVVSTIATTIRKNRAAPDNNKTNTSIYTLDALKKQLSVWNQEKTTASFIQTFINHFDEYEQKLNYQIQIKQNEIGEIKKILAITENQIIATSVNKIFLKTTKEKANFETTKQKITEIRSKFLEITSTIHKELRIPIEIEPDISNQSIEEVVRIIETRFIPKYLQIKLASQNKEPISSALAKKNELSLEAQEIILSQDSLETAKFFAKYQTLSEETESIILNKNQDEVLEYLAENPSISRKLINQFTHHTNWKIRRSLAKNPNLPQSNLEILLRDEDVDVRIEVAHNPTLTTTLQLLISTDENTRVRLALTENTSIQEAVCGKLLDLNSESNILISLAKNPNISEKIQDRLALLSGYDPEIGVALAQNSAITLNTQQTLFYSNHHTPIHLRLYKNPQTSRHIKNNIKKSLSILDFQEMEIEYKKAQANYRTATTIVFELMKENIRFIRDSFELSFEERFEDNSHFNRKMKKIEKAQAQAEKTQYEKEKIQENTKENLSILKEILGIAP